MVYDNSLPIEYHAIGNTGAAIWFVKISFQIVINFVTICNPFAFNILQRCCNFKRVIERVRVHSVSQIPSQSRVTSFV